MTAVDLELVSGARAVLRFPAWCPGAVRHPDAARGESIDAVLRRCGGVTLRVMGPRDSNFTGDGSPAEIFGAELIAGVRYVVGYSMADSNNGDEDSSAVKKSVVLAQHCDGGRGIEVVARDACRLRLEAGEGGSLGAQALTAWLHAGHARIVPPPATSSASSSVQSATNRWLTDLAVMLNARRERAKAAFPTPGSAAAAAGADPVLGPRVLVCSSARGTGKSTVIRSLANVAVREGFHPVVVSASLDGTFASIAAPGAVGAAVMQHPFAPDELLSGAFVPAVQVVVGLSPTRRAGATVEPSRDPSAGGSYDGIPFTPTDASHSRALTHALEAVMDAADTRASIVARTLCGGLLLDAPPDDGSDAYADLLLRMIHICGVDLLLFVGGSAHLRARLRHRALKVRRDAAFQAAGVTPDAPPDVLAERGVTQFDVDTQLGTSHTNLMLPSGELVDCVHAPALAGAVQRLDRDRRAEERAAWRVYFMGVPRLLPLQPIAVSLMPFFKTFCQRLKSSASSSTTGAAGGALAFVRLAVRAQTNLGGMLPIGEDEAAAAASGSSSDVVVSARQIDDDELLRMFLSRLPPNTPVPPPPPPPQTNGDASAEVPPPPAGQMGSVVFYVALSSHISWRPTTNAPSAAALTSPELSNADLESVASSPRALGYGAVVPWGRDALTGGHNWHLVTPSELPFAHARESGAPATDDHDGGNGSAASAAEPVLTLIVMEHLHGGLRLQ